jgi:hypothetical protein
MHDTNIIVLRSLLTPRINILINLLQVEGLDKSRDAVVQFVVQRGVSWRTSFYTENIIA